jgi:hypothetical protein
LLGILEAIDIDALPFAFDHELFEPGEWQVYIYIYIYIYIYAKAVMDCYFELDSPYYECYELEGGVRVAFIACTYHCG